MRFLRVLLLISAILLLPHRSEAGAGTLMAGWNPVKVITPTLAPHFVQAACGSAGSPASLALTLNVNPTAGNVVIAFIENNTSGVNTYTVPNGFNLIDSDPAVNTNNFNSFSWYHVVGANESSAVYTFTPLSATNFHVWCIAEYTNVNANNPVDPYGHGLDYVIGPKTNFPTSTVASSSANEVPVAFYGIATLCSCTWTNAAGWTTIATTGFWVTQLIQGPATVSAGPLSELSVISSATGSPGEPDIVLLNGSTPVGAQCGTQPCIVQSTSGAADAPGSITVSEPATPNVGDVLVAFFWNNGTPTGNITYGPPKGWTMFDSDTSISGFTYQGFYHVVGTGEANSYAFAPSSATRHHQWFLAEYKNVNATNPIDAHGFTPISSSTTWTTPSLTPNQANDLPVAALLGFDCCNNGYSWTNSNGWSQDLGLASSSAWSGNLIHGPLSTLSAVSDVAVAPVAMNGDSVLALLCPAAATHCGGTSVSPYTIGGCGVYSSNDWFTTPVNTGTHPSSYATDVTDPNSAAMLSNFVSAEGSANFGPGTGNHGVVLQQASPTVPNGASLYAVTTPCNYNCLDDPYGDNPNHQIYWNTAWHFDGDWTSPPCYPSNSDGECHEAVLNTTSCVDTETYEAYGPLANNTGGPVVGAGPYTASSLQSTNLNHDFNSQWVTSNHARSFVNAAGLPQVGLVNYGDDYDNYIAQGKVIPHALGMIVVGTDAGSAAIGGYISPASGGNPCSTFCNSGVHLHFGTRMRLDPSKYPCSGGAPNLRAGSQAYYICEQLTIYGVIIDDHGSPGTGIALGRRRDGSDPWVYTGDLDQLVNTPIPITDFIVLQQGTCVGNCSP